jgi:DNA-binding transcriptional regulator YhcF (GntR family)
MSEQKQSFPRSLRKLDPRSEIVAYYTNQIESGLIKPGQQMPTIRNIAKLWDVSMGVAARAVRTMRDQKIVVTDGRHGTHAA